MKEWAGEKGGSERGTILASGQILTKINAKSASCTNLESDAKWKKNKKVFATPTDDENNKER